MLTPEEANFMATYVTLLTFASIVFILAKIFLPTFSFYQKLSAKAKGKCYHYYEPLFCKLEWEHCSICRHELREPWNYHPIVVYKCKECNRGLSELDHEQTKTLHELINGTLKDMEAY